MNIPIYYSTDQIKPVIHREGLPAETGTFVYWSAKRVTRRVSSRLFGRSGNTYNKLYI